MPGLNLFGLPTLVLAQIGQRKGDRIVGIEIDAVITETAHYQNLVTRHPVERGVEITDHVVNQPVVHEMEGRITDTPFSFATSIGSLFGAFPSDPVTAGLASAAGAGLVGKSSPGVAGEKAAFLVTLWKKAKVFAVISGLTKLNPTVYERMVFETLSFPRSAKDGRSIRFHAVMREVITAETLLTLTPVADDVAHTAPSVVDVGHQPTTPYTGPGP